MSTRGEVIAEKYFVMEFQGNAHEEPWYDDAIIAALQLEPSQLADCRVYHPGTGRIMLNVYQPEIARVQVGL